MTTMSSPIRVTWLPAAGLVLAVAVTLTAQRGGTAPPPAARTQADTTARIVAAAQAVAATLDAAGRTRVQFPFEGPQRARWSNLPSGIFKREGLRMGDLAANQRAAVMTLLSTALSAGGYRKVNDIMRGDEVLRTAENSGPGGGRVVFGLDEYYLAFVGTPSTTAPWILQFGGHHL